MEKEKTCANFCFIPAQDRSNFSHFLARKKRGDHPPAIYGSPL